MIHLVLDTNILRGEPYHKALEYKSLEALVKNKKVKIHIPDLVVKEFISQHLVDLEEKTKQAFIALSQLPSHCKTKEIQDTVVSLKTIGEKKYLDQVHQNFCMHFDNFCKTAEVVIDEIKAESCYRAFEKYFNGDLPFGAAKKRDDLPDGFIFEIAMGIKEHNIDVYMITNDHRMQKACEKNKLQFRSSVKKFISIPIVQSHIREIFATKLLTFQTILKDDYRLNSFLIKSNLKKLPYTTVTDDKLISDDNSIIITSVDDPIDIQYDFDHYIQYNKTSLGIPVSYKVKAMAEINIFKQDIYSLRPDILKYSSSPSSLNEHYFTVESLFLLEVKTTIDISHAKLEEIFHYKDLDTKDVVNIDTATVENTVDELEYSMGTIDAINLLDSFIKDQAIEFKCNKCGKYYIIFSNRLNWDEVDCTEREMGAELQYEAEHTMHCMCGQQINITLSSWEYPIGVYNYRDQKLEGANLIANNCTHIEPEEVNFFNVMIDEED